MHRKERQQEQIYLTLAIKFEMKKIVCHTFPKRKGLGQGIRPLRAVFIVFLILGGCHLVSSVEIK